MHFETLNGYAIEGLSALIFVLFLIQLFATTRGGKAHVRIGRACGVIGALLFLAVIARGVSQYGQAHGKFYAAHLVLGGLFFIGLALVIRTGSRLDWMLLDQSRMQGYERKRSRHLLSVVFTGVMLLSSLVMGLLATYRQK